MKECPRLDKRWTIHTVDHNNTTISKQINNQISTKILLTSRQRKIDHASSKHLIGLLHLTRSLTWSLEHQRKLQAPNTPWEDNATKSGSRNTRATTLERANTPKRSTTPTATTAKSVPRQVQDQQNQIMHKNDEISDRRVTNERKNSIQTFSQATKPQTQYENWCRRSKNSNKTK